MELENQICEMCKKPFLSVVKKRFCSKKCNNKSCCNKQTDKYQKHKKEKAEKLYRQNIKIDDVKRLLKVDLRTLKRWYEEFNLNK